MATAAQEPGPAHGPSRVVRNTAVLASGELLGRVFSLAAVVYLSRVLLPAGLGVLDVGIAVFSIASQFSADGVTTLAAARVARGTHTVRSLAGITVVVSWLHTLATLAVVAGVVALAPGRLSTAALWFVLCALLTPLDMRFAFVGRERMGIIGTTRALSWAIFLPLSLALVRGPEDLWLLPTIWAVVEAGRVMPMLVLFLRTHGRPRIPRGRRLWVWLRFALPVSLSRLARLLLSSLAVLLLGMMSTPAAVGLYGAARRLPMLANLLVQKLLTASFPVTTRAVAERDADKLRRLQGQLVVAVIAVCTPALAAVSLSATPVLTLIFGAPFAGAGPLLAVLIWLPVVSGLAGTYRNLLVAHRPADTLRVTLIGLGCAVLTMLALVPALGGLGAVIGTVVGEAVLLVAYALSVRGLMGGPPRVQLGLLAATALATAVVAASAHLAGGWPALTFMIAVLGVGAVSSASLGAVVARRLSFR
jgi:O-antigen/teichoic acid export membrane protein